MFPDWWRTSFRFSQHFNFILPLDQKQLLTTMSDEEPPDKSWFKELLRNPVVAVAIAGCVMVVLVVLVFTTWRCKQQKRKSRRLEKE